MNNSLYSVIQNAQRGSKESMSYLLEKFSPLIKKLSYQTSLIGQIDQEDALAELQLELILLIQSIRLDGLVNISDGALVNYIARSIKRVKLTGSSSTHETVGLEDLSPAEIRKTQYKHSTLDTHDRLLLLDLKKCLTSKEFMVIKGIFFEEQSVKEIAIKLGVTRQSVNQIKLRALRKLKKIFSVS